MTLLQLPHPTFELTTREAWSDDLYQARVADEDAYDMGEAFHLPGLTIDITATHLVLGALQKLANTNQENGLPGYVARKALENKTFWNSLIAGSLSEVEVHQIVTMAEVQDYIAFRASLVQKVNANFLRNYPYYGEIFRQGIKTGQELGYVPEEVTIERTDDTVRDAVVYVCDETILEQDYKKAIAGDYSMFHDEIRISSDGDHLKGTTIHELRHRLAGATFVIDPETGVIMRKRSGFQQRRRHRALDEALVEHTTVSILDGQWEVLDPRERSKDRRVYFVERVLLSVLIDMADGALSLKTMMRASFEDTRQDGGVAERREMMRQFRRAYGPGSVHRFGRLVERLVDLGDSKTLNELVEIFTDKVQPPNVNSSGSVLMSGYINLNI